MLSKLCIMDTGTDYLGALIDGGADTAGAGTGEGMNVFLVHLGATGCWLTALEGIVWATGNEPRRGMRWAAYVTAAYAVYWVGYLAVQVTGG